MITKENKNIHTGHRQRLLNLIINSGLENVSPIQAVEFLCTFINPRQDVNPLAHNLLEEFGSLSAILDANYLQLSRVKGMTVTGAKKLSLFKDIFNLYKKDKLESQRYLRDLSSTYNYLSAMLNYHEKESIVFVGLDDNYKIIADKKFPGTFDDKVILDLKDLAFFAVNYKIKKLIVAHNHPKGKAFPSGEDITCTNEMGAFCQKIGAELSDHFILAKDGIYSFKNAATYPYKDFITPNDELE